MTLPPTCIQYRITLEARQALGVVREGFRQDLDRDISVLLGIARPIHLAHAALADLGGDLIDADACAGCARQVAELYGPKGLRTR